MQTETAFNAAPSHTLRPTHTCRWLGRVGRPLRPGLQLRVLPIVGLLSVYITLSQSGLAQLPTAELTSLSRAAGQVGSTFELQLSGSRLDELQSLTISNRREANDKGPKHEGANHSPSIASELRTTSPRLLSEQPTPTNSFNVQIGDTALPGLVEVRGLGRFGLSNPRRLLVTAKPILIPTSDRSSQTTSQILQGNEIVFDRCAPQKLSYFHVALPAGASLKAVAYAQQLDSRAALVARLLDADGKELTRGRGVGAWPAELETTAQEATEGFIVLHDSLYQGGAEYPFVLEVVINSDAAAPQSLELNQLLRPKFAPPAGALSDPLDHVATPPFFATGNFSQAPSGFDFVAKAQQTFSLRVASAAMGQLTDPRLVVYKVESLPAVEGAAANAVKLSQLAEQDDAPTVGRPDLRERQADPALVWTAPEEATYRAVVLDNQAGERPGDAQQFTLAVDQLKPGFRLLAYHPLPTNNPAAARPAGTNLLRGGTEELRVLAMRDDGYAGPIEVQVENLPAGLTSAPMIIPANQNETALILRAAEDMVSWHGELSIVGRAQMGEQGEQTLESRAQYATVVWSAIPTRNAVQHRRSENLMLSVSALDLAPLLVELGDGTLTEITQGDKKPLLIKATRREGGQAECLLRPQQLPPGLALGELKIAADQSELTTELAIAADAAVGEHTWWMQNETKVKFKPNPQALVREEAYLAQLQAALAVASTDPEKQKLTEAITAVTAAVEELKKQTAEQEFTVWLPTTPHRVRILAKP